VTASNAWPDSIVEMEREVEKQVAAPAETRTPNLHRANETLIESADGRVATAVARKSFGDSDHSATELVYTAARVRFMEASRGSKGFTEKTALRHSPPCMLPGASRPRCSGFKISRMKQPSLVLATEFSSQRPKN
jgi:hypothetical protein